MENNYSRIYMSCEPLIRWNKAFNLPLIHCRMCEKSFSKRPSLLSAICYCNGEVKLQASKDCISLIAV